ncbi:MAG: hypothetical protein PHX13_10345 [Thiovulaceae bacterium]|nr:hypothetical protein [Sulfurimonadaceae bacterium]
MHLTQIREARWTSKSLFINNEMMNFYSPVLYQGEDLFIETTSLLLFEIVCEHFFNQYPDIKIEIFLQGLKGVLFAKEYKIYTYDLIHEALSGKHEERDIFSLDASQEDICDLAVIEAHTKEHHQKLKEIVELLGIDFKTQRDVRCRRLFDTRDKENLRVEEI